MADFYEMDWQLRLSEMAGKQGTVQELVKIECQDQLFPIISFQFGSQDKSKPTLALFAGVHGLEKVGTHLVLTFLENLLYRLSWDDHLHKILEETRLVLVPMVNPGGVFLQLRANARGVDLMRNAPTEAKDSTPLIMGGHRLGSFLPWFRGVEGEPMELENQTVVKFVKEEVFPSQWAFSMDVHSGFGARDRLWYPYGKTRQPFPLVDEAEQFHKLMNRSLPYNVYKVEPQSNSYLIHGDLWDYLFDLHYKEGKEQKGSLPQDKVFIPWTLEMGSWIWIKKNPTQLIKMLGVFHPIKPHRYKRMMRRHIPLFYFMLRAVANYQNWRKVL